MNDEAVLYIIIFVSLFITFIVLLLIFVVKRLDRKPPVIHSVNNERPTENRHITPNAPPETPEFSINNLTPLPRYVSQDAELPSYEAAIATETYTV